MALVTSVRNGNSYAGICLFVRVRIDHHHHAEEGRHIEWGTGGPWSYIHTSIESDPN